MEHRQKPRYYVVELAGSPCLVSTYYYNEAGSPVCDDKSGFYKLHWGTSPQYATYANITVIENYGVVTEDPDLLASKDEVNIKRFRGIVSDSKINDPDYLVEDLIRLHFAKMHIGVKHVIPTCSDGWISPDGEFYACDVGQHTSLASTLAEVLYESFDEERCLEDHKWLKMYNTGRVAYLSADNVTLAQEDCLITIQNSDCADSLFLQNLKQELFEITEKQINSGP